MRVLFVVQRYGVEVNGGAEQHCRWLAEALHELGHDVHVATTTARDYTTWADHYVDAESVLNGVVVHRFPVDALRDIDLFNEFSQRIDFVGRSHSIDDEIEWLRLQGPLCSGLDRWIDAHGESFDVVVVFTYLYRSAHHAVHRLSGRVPIAMHATAHDEPPFHLRTVQALLQKVDLFLCSTPEESDLLGRTLGPQCRRAVVGVGVPPRRPVPESEQLARLGVSADDDFVLILGRVDGSKGVLPAVRAISQNSAGREHPTRIVVAGQNVAGLASNEQTTFLGFVTDDHVTALLGRCSMLLQPSPWESFSLVVCEAWLAGKPVIVNRASDVMEGHVLRSQGGLTFGDAAELRAAVEYLSIDSHARDRMGAAGRRYVESQFRPEVVCRRIEEVLIRLSSQG